MAKLLWLAVFVIIVSLIIFCPQSNRKVKNKLGHNISVADELQLVKRSNSIIKYYKYKNIKEQYAYATFFSSSSFFPAFQVFLYSLNKNVLSLKESQVVTSTLIIGMCDSSTSMINAAVVELAKYPNINYEIHNFPYLESIGDLRERWNKNWSKLFLWSIIDYKVIFYIDLDVLFLENVNDAFSLKIDSYLGSSDSGHYNPPNTKLMNGGVFLMNPSLETLKLLISTRSQNISDYAWWHAEQGLFNFVFRSKCCMPLSYNVQKTHERYWSRYWNIKSIKILHFTAEKPWSSWSSPYVRDSFISQKLRFIGKLRQSDSWDADMFQNTHNLWKQYYFEARNHSLSKLTFFVGIRDTSLVPELSSSHYSSLLQYRYILVENISSFKYDESLNTKLGLLFSADELVNSEFVGVSSLQREEESIDWTKVELKENTIYYWSGFHSDSYYEDQEHAYPGTISMIKDLLGSLPPVPTGYFLRGSFLICSRTVFKRITTDFKNVIKIYHSKYGSSCPDCFEHFVETYINIWMVVKNVNSVFAVDSNLLSSLRNKGDGVYKDSKEYFAH